jgi:hypothetical protein
VRRKNSDDPLRIIDEDDFRLVEAFGSRMDGVLNDVLQWEIAKIGFLGFLVPTTRGK